MGGKLGGSFDIDSFTTPSGATLHDAALFMAPFCAANGTGWPYPHVHAHVLDLELCRLVFRMAANHWQNSSWEEISRNAPRYPSMVSLSP